MHFFTEAICILLRLYARLCENIDHLSPVEAGAGTELGKNIVQLVRKKISFVICKLKISTRIFYCWCTRNFAIGD